MQLTKSKRILHDGILYCAILIAVYLSGSYRINLLSTEKLSLALTAVLLLLSFLISFRQLSKRTIIFGGILCLYFAICILNYSATWLRLALRFIIFFVMILFSLEIKKSENGKDVFFYLYNLILVLCAAGLVLYFFTALWDIGLPNQEYAHQTRSGPIPAYNYFEFLFLVSPQSILGIDAYRFQLFFWEPGVLGVYLNYALFYLIFRKGGKNVWELLILLLSLILTFSTTGICIGCMLFAVYIVNKTDILKKKPYLSASVFLIAFAVALAVFLEKKNSPGVSYTWRKTDLLIGFRLMLDKPLLGYGYINTAPFEATQEILYGSARGNTNGIATWAFTMGLVGLALLFLPFIYRTVKSKSLAEVLTNLIWFGMFILTNMTEPLLTTPLMLMVLANEYTETLFPQAVPPGPDPLAI